MNDPTSVEPHAMDDETPPKISADADATDDASPTLGQAEAALAPTRDPVEERREVFFAMLKRIGTDPDLLDSATCPPGIIRAWLACLSCLRDGECIRDAHDVPKSMCPSRTLLNEPMLPHRARKRSA